MNPKIDLSGLRDLHLLDKPSLWPLATGWWIVVGILILALIIALISFMIWHNKPSVYAARKARHMAEDIKNDLEYLKNISHLLKRVAIAAYGRPKIAPLSDEKWQNFLISAAPDTLTKNEAHLIAFAPYENKLKHRVSRDNLTNHCLLWIKKVLKNKKSS